MLARTSTFDLCCHNSLSSWAFCSSRSRDGSCQAITLGEKEGVRSKGQFGRKLTTGALESPDVLLT